MRVVFMGTPDFAVPSLTALAKAHEVTLVVTRPDAVRGRGRELMPSPVKARALELGIPVLETKRMGDEQIAAVRAAAPDVICVVAFGCILPDSVIGVGEGALASLGAVNVHASLLPRWRGAAPIQRAILSGDELAGVSIMRVAHDLDAGAWCAQASTSVGEKGCEELTSELAGLGAAELLAALDAMQGGTAVWTEQDEDQVTVAAKVSKAEMRLDPADSVATNARRVQASGDTAPARLTVAGKGVRAMAARVAGANAPQVESGFVLVEKKRVLLGCADGALELTSVKPDGKRQMEARAWAAGLRGDVRWEAVS